MSARRKPDRDGTLPAVTGTRFLVVAEKAAPFGGSAEPFGTKPQGGADAMPVVPDAETPEPDEEEVETHEWSGDLVDEGVTEISDPAGAFSQFTGQEGETAWLDQADDLTLTGWVRDADGSVYRYSDADAWAVDVDDAGMVPTDPGAEQDPEVEEDPLDEEAMAVEDGSATEQEPFDLEGKQVVLRAVVLPKVTG